MDFKGSLFALYRGFIDSFKGALILFYLDKEMNDRAQARQALAPIRRRETDTQESVPVRALKENEESKVLSRTCQCCILNGGIFMLSVVIFDYGLLPLINLILGYIFGQESFMSQFIWSWINPLLSIVFKVIWVLPLFLLSKVVNSLWFQDIADSAYRYTRGRPQFIQSLSKLMADLLFSIVVQAVFLVQAFLVELIPIYMVGSILSMVHMCLLYSLYAFEYKWINMGWELHRRLSYIETNLPYFIGFGLPLMAFTRLFESFFISACIFSVTFPVFIISANEASPVAANFDFPIHLFSPAIKVTNYLLNQTIGSKKPLRRPSLNSSR